MSAPFISEYPALDQPEILAYLFYPRPGFSASPPVQGEVLMIPVAEEVAIEARCYPADPQGCTILFFHGNGEIAQDYDDLGPLYVERGINLIVADYRGYGRSSGWPTASTMLADSHVILDFCRAWLRERGYHGPLLAMGRSLGSASALELACRHPTAIAGLILESAFAYTGPLLRRIGVESMQAGHFTESQGFRQLDKIRTVRQPTLVIHAAWDHLIPFDDGQALYDASPAADKHLLPIPRADHNTILALGLRAYLQGVERFADPARFASAA